MDHAGIRHEYLAYIGQSAYGMSSMPRTAKVQRFASIRNDSWQNALYYSSVPTVHETT